MSPLKISLFGTFDLQWDSSHLKPLPSAKARELLCYLLLHRDRSHSREVLATMLWGDRTTAQSKKYFRQTLWQLQMALHVPSSSATPTLLRTDGDLFRLDSGPHLWLDTAVFETAFLPVRGVAGENMDDQQAGALRAAAGLYRGELLEGWYYDWCLFHRERLQNIYLSILDKLVGYCEARHDFEIGLAYGELLMRQDPVREGTYRRLMRLRHLAGDRAGALRLFNRCEEVLQKELGVPPETRTIALYNRIRTDQVPSSSTSANNATQAIKKPPIAAAPAAPSGDLQRRLWKLRALLLKVQRQLEREILDVDQVLAPPGKSPSVDNTQAAKTVAAPQGLNR